MSEELKERIHDLLKINVEHQNLNADLRKEVKYLKERAVFYQEQCDQLKKENRELRSMGKDFIDEHRNKGNI
jgi:cell division protein FtsB|tara:strand:+ start:459 stop:674 length:216 start_codon:yes stop_codon:yes gene_type:complete